MTAHAAIFSGRFCKSVTYPVLSNFKFLNFLKTMLTIVNTSEVKYGICFFGSNTEHFATNLEELHFFARAILATCKRHICASKTMLCCLSMLKYVVDEAKDVFKASRFESRVHAASSKSNMLLLPCGAKQCIACQDRLMRRLPVREFFKACAHFSVLWSVAWHAATPIQASSTTLPMLDYSQHKDQCYCAILDVTQ